MKKNKAEAQGIAVAAETKQENTLNLSTLRPSDELQVYYNDAYMREKQRFNDMFGLLEEDVPAPEAVKKFYEADDKPNIDLSQYVPVKKYKKVKSTATLFVLLTIICAAAAAFFGLKYMGIF
ncbi:hypothetical protein EOM82_04190 [bacterium]|nr:hypothetical protein [bacterium]